VQINEVGGAFISHGGITTAYAILVKILKGKDHPEDLVVDGRIILKHLLGSSVGECEYD
jgi:hypothetical protein